MENTTKNPYTEKLTEIEKIARAWDEGFSEGFAVGGESSLHKTKLYYILRPLEAHAPLPGDTGADEYPEILFLDRKAMERKIQWLSGEDAEGHIIAEVMGRALKMLPTL